MDCVAHRLHSTLCALFAPCQIPHFQPENIKLFLRGPLARLLWLLLLVGTFSVGAEEAGSRSSRMLRLHVVDSNGDPVEGLRQDMFNLTNDSETKQQPNGFGITHFDEIKFTKASSEPRTLIIVLDSNNLNKPAFDRFVAAVDYFIDHLKRQEDVVKIVHMDNGMRHLTPFTTDPSVLHEGLASVHHQGRLLRDLKIHERRILVKVLALLEQPKLQIIERNDVNFLVENKEIRKKDFLHAFYINMLSLHRLLEPIQGSKTIFWLTGGAYVEYDGRISNTDELMVRLGETFNSGNITVHSLLDKSNLFLFHSLAISNKLNEAWTPEIDARSLAHSSQFPPNPKENGSSNTVLENRSQLATGPREIAARTGGFLSISREKDLKEAFSQLLAKSSHYYEFGYTSDSETGSVVNVNLKEARRNYQLLYGSNYEETIPYMEMTQERRHLEFEYLLCYSREFRNDFQARWGYYLFQGEDGTNRIPVHMHIPPKKLSGTKLEIGFALIDADYRVIDITYSVVTGYKPNLLTQVLYDVLISEELPSFIRYYVRDLRTGKLSVGELAIGAVGNRGEGTHLSQILLSTANPVQMLVLPNLRLEKAGKARLRRTEDPLSLGNTHFPPQVDTRFAKPELILFYFHLYNAPKKQDNYSFSLKVNRADGQPVLIGSTLNRVHPVSRRTYHYYGSVDTRSLGPGAYDLLVEITDRETGKRFQRKRHFNIGTELAAVIKE